MKVIISVEASSTRVEARGESPHSGTALIRALDSLAEVTNDDQLRDLAKRIDRLGQMEYGWPATIEAA